jgi:hypothetical protein
MDSVAIQKSICKITSLSGSKKLQILCISDIYSKIYNFFAIDRLVALLMDFYVINESIYMFGNYFSHIQIFDMGKTVPECENGLNNHTEIYLWSNKFIWVKKIANLVYISDICNKICNFFAIDRLSITGRFLCGYWVHLHVRELFFPHTNFLYGRNSSRTWKWTQQPHKNLPVK